MSACVVETHSRKSGSLFNMGRHHKEWCFSTQKVFFRTRNKGEPPFKKEPSPLKGFFHLTPPPGCPQFPTPPKVSFGEFPLLREAQETLSWSAPVNLFEKPRSCWRSPQTLPLFNYLWKSPPLVNLQRNRDGLLKPPTKNLTLRELEWKTLGQSLVNQELVLFPGTLM